MRPAPEWLRRWRGFAMRLRRALWDLETTLAILTRLTRTPITTQLTLRLVPSAFSAAAMCFDMVPRNPVALSQIPAQPERCLHRNVHRSGNQHGQFAKCKTCDRRWRWDQAARRWLVWQPLSRQSSASGSSIPLPTPADTLQFSAPARPAPKRQAPTPTLPPAPPTAPPNFDLTEGDLTSGDMMDDEEAPWTVPSSESERDREPYNWDEADAEPVFDFPQD